MDIQYCFSMHLMNTDLSDKRKHRKCTCLPKSIYVRKQKEIYNYRKCDQSCSYFFNIMTEAKIMPYGPHADLVNRFNECSRCLNMQMGIILQIPRKPLCRIVTVSSLSTTFFQFSVYITCAPHLHPCVIDFNAMFEFR